MSLRSSLTLLLTLTSFACSSSTAPTTEGNPDDPTGANLDGDAPAVTTGDLAAGSSTGGSGGAPAAGAGTDVPADAIRVSTTPELNAALSGAQPGDVIALAPGVYSAPAAQTVDFAGAARSVYFFSEANGTPAAPITLLSEDAESPAVLEGLGTDDSSYLLWIHGENWVLDTIILRDGGKGLILDDASGSVVSGIEVYNVGDEAIHLRSGTSNALIEDCIIDGAGLNQPGFGEGIYIGSDNGQWDTYNRVADNNTIRGCTIRGTAAEAVDVKEGTKGNIIEACAIYGGSISGENFADSFIDLKGESAQVRQNLFYKENNATVTRGVAIVERPQGPTALDNWIFDNTFYMDDTSGLMVHAYAGEGNHAWSNQRSPAGEEYNGNAPELAFTDPR